MAVNAFPYPGNKAQHADWITEYLPEHTCYVEVFGGAAGVLFNKPESEVEVYNDLDGDIVHFFEVLRGRPDELTEWLRAVPFSRDLHEEWATAYYDGLRPSDDVERAGRWFYLRYSQFGGKYYGNSGFATKQSNNPARPFAGKVERLHDLADRLRHVTIENEPWAEIIDRYDGGETLFYLDPPYRDTEYQYGSEGFDHRALYDVVSSLDGRCLLSYDSVPEWYGGEFQVRSKEANFAINNVGGTGPKEATEYLILNYDPSETSTFTPPEQSTLGFTNVADRCSDGNNGGVS